MNSSFYEEREREREMTEKGYREEEKRRKHNYEKDAIM